MLIAVTCVAMLGPVVASAIDPPIAFSKALAEDNSSRRFAFTSCSAVAERSTAIDLVSEHGGRLIKLIGDEVMFSTVAPDTACRIASELIRHAEAWVTSARGGIAHGPVVASGGDVYGETVNLASRIADIAVPGELLVNEAVVAGAPDLAFEPAGRRQLKGFPAPTRLWSLTVTQ